MRNTIHQIKKLQIFLLKDMNNEEEIKKGLLGIVVDETTISQVVPELSALTYEAIQFKNCAMIM